MRVIGALNWYDENPQWLREAVQSAYLLCDDVVALEGPYLNWPALMQWDADDQWRAVKDAGGRPFNFGMFIDQVDKRTQLFSLARNCGADWVFVFDADDLVQYVPADTRRLLEQTPLDVAAYTLGGDRYHRGLFRMYDDLRVQDAHYHIVATKNGEEIHLRGNEHVHQLEPFLNLTHVRVQHRTAERTPERIMASREYRKLVAEHEIEPTTPEAWRMTVGR